LKKKRTFVFVLFFIAGLIFLHIGCNRSEKTYELRFAQPFSPKHTIQTMVIDPWAKKIEEMSGGRVKVTMFPGGALGKAADHYSLAEKGVADIVYALQDYTPGRFPLTSVFELPFMIPSAEKTSVAMWKTYEKFPEFQKEYSDVKVLALFCHPPGHFNTISKPIRTLDDFNGLKIRTASQPAVTNALKIFGAVPVTMAVSDSYSALERGVVDGTVLPWEGLYVFNQAELLKYSTETDFYTTTMMFVMNKKKYNSLPDDIKKIIDETTGLVLSRETGRVYDSMRPVYKERCLEKGMQTIKLPPEDTEKLKTLTMPLREEWVKEMDKKGLPGKAVLDAAIKYINE
jgi:TRAP-type C4-dicarboxylate transport system substrate-binding protein